MLHCFQWLCVAERAVLMIGADVPHADQQWLGEAEARLAAADVILGPSSDGGYCLVAMRRPHDIFTGIQMGTDQVLGETVRKAAQLGLRTELLPPTFDVDEPGDIERLRLLLQQPGSDLNLPQTSALLHDWEAATS